MSTRELERVEVMGRVAGTETSSTLGAHGTSGCCEKSEKRSPLAAELQEHEAWASQPGNRSAARWDPHFRFALKNRASLQCISQRKQTTTTTNINPKRGRF